MLSCFDKIIDTAIGVEVHNRNAEGYKPDPTLKDTYVLVSAFEDGENIIPVKLEVKEFTDKDNSLYVAIALESIKKDEVVKQGNTETGVTQDSRSSIIRIADLFSKINPNDVSFIKYIPSQFLSDSEDLIQHQSRIYEDDESAGTQKNNTKTSAASPLSRGLAKQGSFSMASEPVTAAAKNLGITETLPQLSDSVKDAICLFSDVADAIDNNAPVRGGKKPISADNLIGSLVANGLMSRRGSGKSVYWEIGTHTLRVSAHSTHAENFETSGENLSISLLNPGKTNDFKSDASKKVIEAKFRKKFLNKNPYVFRKVIEDIARFVVTGEYHDTAGALDYNLSGGKDFEVSAIIRLYDDAVARNDEAMAEKLADGSARRCIMPRCSFRPCCPMECTTRLHLTASRAKFTLTRTRSSRTCAFPARRAEHADSDH